MPALASAFTACNALPTISPAACMASSSPGVLAGIIFFLDLKPMS